MKLSEPVRKYFAKDPYLKKHVTMRHMLVIFDDCIDMTIPSRVIDAALQSIGYQCDMQYDDWNDHLCITVLGAETEQHKPVGILLRRARVRTRRFIEIVGPYRFQAVFYPAVRGRELKLWRERLLPAIRKAAEEMSMAS